MFSASRARQMLDSAVRAVAALTRLHRNNRPPVSLDVWGPDDSRAVQLIWGMK